ncbi:hypothetical protein I4U23_023037 [Adineta vaga]|nr:hypothetical protein I4U23_023037 [Adineta vaga]
MGIGAFIPIPIPVPLCDGTSNDSTQQIITNEQVSNVLIPKGLPSLRNITKNEQRIHVIKITTDPLIHRPPIYVQCGDVILFEIKGNKKHDIIQVYKECKSRPTSKYQSSGLCCKEHDNYYRIKNGYALFDITNRTPEKDRLLPLSIELPPDQSEIDLYFCVIRSSQRDSILEDPICPEKYCELNHLKMTKRQTKISLTKEETNQLTHLYKGDTIELDWSTEHETGYQIEEKKYCPISAGLYTIPPTLNKTSSSRRKYRKTFNEYGMSYLFRLTDTNQIHDITVCVVNNTYNRKYVSITDYDIRPNFLTIEQDEWVIFEWDTTNKQSIVQIEPFHIDDDKDDDEEQVIELRNGEQYFSWPRGATHRGYVCHQFKEIGAFCFRTASGEIGTIIVEPKQTIHKLKLFNDELICEMNTRDFIQFNWDANQPKDQPVFIAKDSKTSRLPAVTSDLPYIFDCAQHQCKKIEPFFRYHFHSCEIFLFNIPQYGFYNFSYSNNPDYSLISAIVQNGSHTHRVSYTEANLFQPRILKINRHDRVLFHSSSTRRNGRIYQIDKHGNRLNPERRLFHSQRKNTKQYMETFSNVGVFYFSTDIQTSNTRTSSTCPFTIVVLPETTFHCQSIEKGNFYSNMTITKNRNDFVIWKFDRTISHGVIRIPTNISFEGLTSIHSKAERGRLRKCLAIYCKELPIGASFFANPDFETTIGSFQDLLISTVIIDPIFRENYFTIANNRVFPHTLYVAQDETVSWVLADREPNPRSYQRSIETDSRDSSTISIDGDFVDYIEDVFDLHTFDQTGRHTFHSDRFRGIATVCVVSAGTIQKRQVEVPVIIEEIDPVTPIDTEIHLDCPNHRNARIYYTSDGTLPTQHNNNVHLYDRRRGACFHKGGGLRILRAYATDDQKLSSSIVTSRPTYVFGNDESEPVDDNDYLVKLSADLQYLNTLHGTITLEPPSASDLIDHFELLIDDVVQKKNIKSNHFRHTVQGFAPGDQYKVHVVAYPKSHITDARPIPSKRLDFTFQAARTPNVRPPITPIKISIAPSGDKDRAKKLYLKLQRAMWSHSLHTNSTFIHPHIAFPSVPHYTDDASLTVKTGTLSNETYIHEGVSRLEEHSSYSTTNPNSDSKTSTGDKNPSVRAQLEVHNPSKLDDLDSVSAEITVETQKKDHKKSGEDSTTS